VSRLATPAVRAGIARALDALARGTAAMPELPERISEIDVRSPEALHLRLRRPYRNLVCTDPELPTELAKYARLESTVAARAEALAQIDLRFAGRIVVRPPETPPSPEGTER
jgi:hypothetical protein